MNDYFCQEDDATITDSNTTHCKEQLILTSDEEDDEGDSAENIIGTLLINKYCLMDINWAHVLTHSLTFVYFHVLSDVLMVVLVVTTALEVLQYKKQHLTQSIST